MNVTIFGTPVCPNCGDVKRFLESAGVDYEYKTVGQDISPGDLTELIGRPVRSVPVIVNNGSEVTFEQLRNTVGMNQVASGLHDMSL